MGVGDIDLDPDLGDSRVVSDWIVRVLLLVVKRSGDCAAVVVVVLCGACGACGACVACVACVACGMCGACGACGAEGGEGRAEGVVLEVVVVEPGRSRSLSPALGRCRRRETGSKRLARRTSPDDFNAE